MTSQVAVQRREVRVLLAADAALVVARLMAPLVVDQTPCMSVAFATLSALETPFPIIRRVGLRHAASGGRRVQRVRVEDGVLAVGGRVGIVSQVVGLQSLQIGMSRTTVGAGIDWIVDRRTHDGVVGTPFVTGQGRQRQGVPEGRGVRWGSNRAQVVRHDAWESARQPEGR